MEIIFLLISPMQNIMTIINFIISILLIIEIIKTIIIIIKNPEEKTTKELFKEYTLLILYELLWLGTSILGILFLSPWKY